jgi:hypothetical protein
MKKLYVVLILCLVAAHVHPDNLDGKIKKFWSYISKNEAKIANATPDDVSVYEEMYKQIQLINDNLAIMLENKITNGRRNLIITANGNPDFFALCDRIVLAAPRLKILKPISLFPALDIIEPFILYDITLNVEDVRVHFDSATDSSLLFILPAEDILRIKSDKSGEIYNIYMQMLYTMTQQILGERIMGTEIQSCEIYLANVLIPAVPLQELKNYMQNQTAKEYFKE